MTAKGIDRRSLLRLAGVSLLAGGCRGAVDDPTIQSPSSGSRAGASGSPLSLPAAERYVPLPGEAVPNGKSVAADFVQAMTTRSAGQRPEDVLALGAPLTGAGFAADAALLTAAPLYDDEVSVGSIVYPQLGGLLPLGAGARQASVMVVVEQRLLSRQGNRRQVVRVCEVRLEVQQGQWKVVELASAGGQPVDRPRDLDPQAARVLDNDRLELPDTSRWDVHAGLIDTALLEVLDRAAVVAPLAVTVLRNGHPTNVFGTTKVSDHTKGRAVDVWKIDGQPLVSTGASTGAARAVLQAAAADTRIAQTGSPQGSDLDGPGKRRSFTDLVHRDHLHLAVRESPARG